MLKVEELEKQLNQGVAQGIYLLYGEETFLLEQTSVLVLSNYGSGEFDNVVEDIL